VHPKRYLPTSPRGVTTQKANVDSFTAVKTSDFIKSAQYHKPEGHELNPHRRKNLKSHYLPIFFYLPFGATLGQ
jgi:hypothetical protein